MAKEKDRNNGFMIDDIVKHKSGMIGRIDAFEHAGIQRAVIETPCSSGYCIVSVLELELVKRAKEVNNEERNEEGNGSKD